ncbi:MAG: cytidylyltransferase domain-containing protein [Thermoplasmatota archaeon]
MEGNVISIIPARGGSKGIPRKNIKELKGRPLIEHSIEHSLAVDLIDRTIVSTEDEEISEVSKEAGAEVIDRPEELAGDDSVVINAIRYTVEVLEDDSYDVDIIVVLEPTSPIRDIGVTEKCIEVLREARADSAATFSETELSPHRMWRIKDEKVEPFFENANPWLPRQSQPKAYKLNGQVYTLTRDILFEEVGSISLMRGRSYPVITPKETAIDIDTERDFKMIEYLMEDEDGDE